ncbi:MAG TPA: hypothetical protein VL306_03320 [Methylomirabilota bacterium]|nr:hypothetical protein [Methylomirabilota bacterium]
MRHSRIETVTTEEEVVPMGQYAAITREERIKRGYATCGGCARTYTAAQVRGRKKCPECKADLIRPFSGRR